MTGVFEGNNVSSSQETVPRTRNVKQAGDASCNKVRQLNDHTDYSSCHMHPERERHYDSHNQEAHFPFVVYVFRNH